MRVLLIVNKRIFGQVLGHLGLLSSCWGVAETSAKSLSQVHHLQLMGTKLADTVSNDVIGFVITDSLLRLVQADGL